MSVYRTLFFVVISSILLSQHTMSAGPARSIALAASRAIKIPRSIRAPFRNSEMMTARGFGKRALYPATGGYDANNYKESKFDGNKEYYNYGPFTALDMNTPHTLDTRETRLKFHLDDGNLRIGRGFGKRSGDKEYTGPWSYPKHDELASSEADPLLQMFTEQPVESFPIEWFGNEISSTPSLIKSILRRAVDTNRDGMLTINELMGNSPQSAQLDNNGNF